MLVTSPHPFPSHHEPATMYIVFMPMLLLLLLLLLHWPQYLAQFQPFPATPTPHVAHDFSLPVCSDVIVVALVCTEPVSSSSPQCSHPLPPLRACRGVTVFHAGTAAAPLPRNLLHCLHYLARCQPCPPLTPPLPSPALPPSYLSARK